MIGVDTNVILRIFDRRAATQTRIAEELIAGHEKNGGCLLNPIVLVELVWTLERTYKVAPAVVADHLERILDASEFATPFAHEAIVATTKYRSGPADFSDYFLAEINRSLGCSTTFTFDRNAGKDSTFTYLRAESR